MESSENLPQPAEVAAVEVDPRYCGARKKQPPYTPCTRPAGWGTDHAGHGKCKFHGGSAPIKHGRYSKIKRPRLRKLIENHAQDADPLNLYPEIAALRALFQDYIERYDEFVEALLGWYESYEAARRPLPDDLILAFESVIDERENELRLQEEPDPKQFEDIDRARSFLELLTSPKASGRPRQILDIADAAKLLDHVGKMVERVENARNKNAISRADLNRIMHEMWRVIDMRIDDDAVKARIREDWLQIAL